MKSIWLTLLSVFSSFTMATDVSEITPEALTQNPPAELLIIDVRSPKEYAEGHVPGAINIPHTEMSSRIDEIIGHMHKPVVVYCRSGYRAGKASDVLVSNNFSNVMHLEGHMSGWLDTDLPVEN